jgi:hypothetical protein
MTQKPGIPYVRNYRVIIEVLFLKKFRFDFNPDSKIQLRIRNSGAYYRAFHGFSHVRF